MSIAAFLRRFKPRRLVRSWALCAPMLILAISIPLLVPLRSHDLSQMSDDEQANLATVQAIVEQHTLAINRTQFKGTRSKIIGSRNAGAGGVAGHPLWFSNQPPMLALLASGPYWLLHRIGLTFADHPHLVRFLLTLLTVTLPVALSAGLVYRMGRIFELTRPLRAGLALAVVLASGLISYSTVLNPHAPAAALIIAAAASLIHVITHRSPRMSVFWLGLAGFFAALAATLDPPALAFLLAFVLVITAFRWPVSIRIAGGVAYLLGTVLPLGVHAKLTCPLTGDLRPGLFHPELEAAAPRDLQQISATQPHDTVEIPSLSSTRDEDDVPQTLWGKFLFDIWRILGAFFGRHGILTHFPIVLLGIIGVSLIMHRHWPTPTKMLAGATLGAALAIILICALSRANTSRPMFATRWFVVLLPLTLFWSGAWLRRPHRQSSWILAGTLLAFSVIVSLLGATGPLPREGFNYYSAAGAWHNLTHRPPPEAARSPEAGASENARAE
jgi:hypothetical protein